MFSTAKTGKEGHIHTIDREKGRGSETARDGDKRQRWRQETETGTEENENIIVNEKSQRVTKNVEKK